MPQKPELKEQITGDYNMNNFTKLKKGKQTTVWVYFDSW